MQRAGIAPILGAGALVLAQLLSPPTCGAQQAVPAQGVTAPGFAAKPILTHPLSGDAGMEIVVISAGIAPGASSPAHTHPGHCIVTVQSGHVEVRIEGSAARRIGPGEAMVNPPGPIHRFFNVGDTPVRMTQVLLVEKGKPRTLTFRAPLP